MHKFFVSPSDIDGNQIIIKGDDVIHITRVLRLRENDEILINGGYGREYICKIKSSDKNSVISTIEESYANSSEPPVSITLFQGFPKAQKMDLIVQKSVEIGVIKIQPVITQRTVVRLEDRDITSKVERWGKIAAEAAKQSNRGIIPEVLFPISFEEALRSLKAMDLAVIPYENEENRGIKDVIREKNSIKTVGIIIGPEGGFDDSEVNECVENNIIPVTLGPRILRTETAGFVASSFILYEIGDMGGI